MGRATTTIDGVQYELDTTLRVAYRAQGANDHKPYTIVFSSIGDMPLEKQIELIYLSFSIANPEAAKLYPWPKFLDYYLCNSTLKEIMDQLKLIIETILGVDAEETSNKGDEKN